METQHDIRQWNVSRYTFFHLSVRLAVGLLLLLKGIYFVSNSHHLLRMVNETNMGIGAQFLVPYITFAHMFGGAFIILGLLTRVAIILQLPIVIGALYYNLASNEFGTGLELILSTLVLVGLIYLFLKGSGTISMDDYLKKHLL
jgi:uncharacterized membrane protein YphA (DoxX/SURF4 family)